MRNFIASIFSLGSWGVKTTLSPGRFLRRKFSRCRRNRTPLCSIVGHGSTVNPDSSAPSLAQAAEIRRARNFRAKSQCAFWKEEPSLRDALFLFDDPEIREVYVVPNFISEGYFTQTVIPRELELEWSPNDSA